MKNYLFLLLVFLLAGCGTNKIVYVDKTTYKRIPSNLLIPCQITAPPTKVSYALTDLSGREDLLTKLTIKLYGDAAKCNNQIASIKAFDEQQAAIYEKVGK